MFHSKLLHYQREVPIHKMGNSRPGEVCRGWKNATRFCQELLSTLQKVEVQDRDEVRFALRFALRSRDPGWVGDHTFGDYPHIHWRPMGRWFVYVPFLTHPIPVLWMKWRGVDAANPQTVGINQSHMIHIMVRSSDHPQFASTNQQRLQAIKKALNPSALASLEHLHDAWQRSEQGVAVLSTIHLWGAKVMIVCSLSSSDQKLTSPSAEAQNAKLLVWPRSKETTQWYSSLLQNGAVPESNDVPCVRLQAPMAPGIWIGAVGRTHWQVVSRCLKY